MIYDFKRCIGINGINFGTSKTDLLDRAIKIKQERIADEDNKLPEDIWTEFEEIKPQLLGCILDTLVKVKQFIESGQKLNLKKYPRMAEFAKYGEIISRCMGYPENKFIDSYYDNIGLQTQEAVDSDTIASLTVSFMTDKTEWVDTATKLVEEYERLAALQNIDTKSKFWPKTPKALTNRLEMAKTILRSTGILIERQKDTKRNLNLVRLKKISPDSPDSPEPKNQAQNTGTSPEQISDTKYSPEDSPEIHAQKEDSGTTGTTGTFSVTPGENTQSQTYPCHWCPKVFSTVEEKKDHSVNSHPGKPADADPSLVKLVNESE